MISFAKTSFKILQVIFILIFITSCNQNIDFEKTKWNEQSDPVYPSIYRPMMLKDLTTNHKLLGLNCAQLVKYLGGPDYKEANLITYRIAVDYGNDIDPVYSKDLIFFYSKDSVITSFKIEEWKK